MVMKKDYAKSMNTKIIGSGKTTVVLVHGFGSDQSIWGKVLPHLATSYQVILFDWCFSGAIKDHTLYDPIRYSSYDAFAEDLIGLMDELELKSSIYVGHSMSSMIGCIASVKRPDLFNKLILVAGSPRFINLEDYEGGFEMQVIEQFFSSMESNYEEWTSNFASMVVDSNDPSSVRLFENCLRRMIPENALALAKTVFLSDYRHILDQVTTQCNIIRSRCDVVVPESVTDFMRNKIVKKCQVDIIDTEGHFPQLTNYVEFLDVLGKILAK